MENYQTASHGKDFNPRSHEGSDRSKKSHHNVGAIFQSTLPRGERLVGQARRFPCPQKFQSTLPRGERLVGRVVVGTTCVISIHAPTRGATWIRNTRRQLLIYFNPRSHEGSDRIDGSSCGVSIFISIHAPTRGAT